jgi:hypothetical protein
MPAWAWVLIAIAVVVVLALMVWQALGVRRTKRLRTRFGPEYDRTVEGADSRRDAEAELTAREERRQQFDIRPLSDASRTRYRAQWRNVQAQFVDSPAGAVAAGDALIQSVMVERGYPVDDFDQRAADLSVDHPNVVEHYRDGHRLAQRAGEAPTEDLRQAMQHYRALFDELVEPPSEEPVARERATDEATDVSPRAPAEESVRGA